MPQKHGWGAECKLINNQTSKHSIFRSLTLYLQRDAVSATARRRRLRRLRRRGRLGCVGPLRRDKDLLALVYLQRDVFLIVSGVLVAVEGVEVGRELRALRAPGYGGVVVHAPRVVPVRGAQGGRPVGAPGGPRAREGRQAEAEHHRRPQERDVGHDERRRGLAEVPVRPLSAEWLGEAVVLVRDGGADLRGGSESAFGTEGTRCGNLEGLDGVAC